jgi:hypothetical protein
MAIAHDSVSSYVTGTTSITWAHTCTGANRLLTVHLGCTGNSSTPLTSGTYNGVALVSSAQTFDNFAGWTRTFYLVNPSEGTNNVVLTTGTGISNGRAISRSWTGVDQANPVGACVVGIGLSTTPSLTVPSASGEVIVDTVGANTTRITGATASQTDPKLSDASPARAGNAYKAGETSVTLSWSVSSLTLAWVEHGLPIKPYVVSGISLPGVGGLFLGKTGGLIR